MLKQTVEEVQEQGIKFKLLELQIFALQKANKIDAAKSLLRQMEELFPGQGQPTLWLAQIHYHLGDWNSLVQMLDESLQDKELFPAQYLDSLLLMGIHAAIELEQFNLADNWVRLFKELSRDRNDLPLLATIRVQQKLQDYEAIGTSWEQMNDDLLRSKVMREVFRQAEKDFQYDFPISYEFDERYWLDWKAEGQLIKAHSFRMKNQRDEAYRLYQISHALAEDSPVIRERALYHRVLIELEVKDYERSEKHLEQLLASYPESIYRSEYHFWYALVLHEKNLDPIRSLMALRQIDEGSERVDDSLFLQGRIHLEQSNWSQAVRVFRKLKTNLVDSPYLESGLLFLAEAFFQQKNHVEAQAVLSELRQKFNPLQEPIPVIHLQVRNLKAMGAFEEADDLLRKDLQQHSDFSLIQLHLSILEELGDQLGILETSRLGLNLAATENQAFLHLQRANALNQTENFAKAFVHYEQALFSPPAGQQAFIRFRLIKIHYQQKEFGAFESRAKAFLEEDHQSENANDLLLMLGTYHFQQDRPEKAKPYLEQLVSNQVLAVRNPELDPVRRLELVTRIGEQYNLLEDFQSAEQWLNQGLRLMEDLPDQKKDYHLRILREKGLAAFNQGKYNRALSSDLKVNYLDKNLSSEQKYKLSLRIAQSYQKLKRYREAKTIYQKMLKNNKDERLQKEIKSRIKKLEEIDS
jgi:tetratricopeptide (TPR) repeat protein